MHKARSFFYVCAGLSLLSASYLQAKNAAAQPGILQKAPVVAPHRASRQAPALAPQLPPYLAENLPPELARSWARVLARILARATDHGARVDVAHQERDLGVLIKYKIVMGIGNQGSPICIMVGKGFYSLTYQQREFVAMQMNDYLLGHHKGAPGEQPGDRMPDGRWRRDVLVVKIFDLCDGYSGVRLYSWDGERMVSP